MILMVLILFITKVNCSVSYTVSYPATVSVPAVPVVRTTYTMPTYTSTSHIRTVPSTTYVRTMPAEVCPIGYEKYGSKCCSCI